ncbi:MAG: PKD domain-containing protein [Bacteroidota bacterium]|nr:PKD domain-containing protein [Bacteroidota bacterium]
MENTNRINSKYFYIILFIFISFSTFSQVTVFTETFENNGQMPTGWTQEYVHDTLNWSFTSGGNSNHPSSANNGTYNALLYYGGIYRKTKLITPAINLTYYSNVQLKFYHTQENYSGDQDYLRVFYKTSATGSWTQLQYYNTNVSTWTQRTINLPNTSTTTYYIAFEGDARYGYGVCVDDVEISGNVANGLDIKLASIASPLIWNAGNNTLKVNYRNVRSDTINNADFGYKIDNNTAVHDTNVTISGGLLPDEIKTHTFSNTINISQGNHFIKVWSTKPNRTQPDDDTSNDTLTLSFRTGIQDTFYIDSAGNGDYTTFAAAVADLNYGVTGPTVFIVSAGTYSERIIIGEIPGADSSNTIIFKGVDKDSVTLTYQGLSGGNRATVNFKGCDYITFKDMKIHNTGTTYGVCVLFRNESDHNTFSNCELKVSTTSTSQWQQVILASSTENSVGAIGNNANYMHFENCDIIGGYYGARLEGSNTASMCIGNTFSGCSFQQQYYYGIYSKYQKDLHILNNSLINFRGYYAYGILSYYNTASIFDGNNIQPGRYGIYLYRENNFYTSNSTIISNNMISNFKSSTYQTGIYGYYYCYNLKILHNSIWVNGSVYSYGYAAIRLWYYPKYSIIKNNILSSTYNTMLLSLYYASDVTIDYNDYFYDTISTNKFYNNSYYSNFSAFKNSSSYIVTPHDQHSFDNFDPKFISQSNLHLDTLNTPSLMAPYCGVAIDYDKDLRDSTIGCNLGADEINHPSIDLDIISIDTPIVLSIGTNNVDITLRNMGTDSILPQKIYVSYSIANNSWVNDSITITSKLPPFDTLHFSFSTPFTISNIGTYNLCTRIYPQILNDYDNSDSFCVSKCVGLSGTFYIDNSGNGDYTTFGAAITALNSCGISGAVKFIVKAGTYIEKIELTGIPGASGTNTIIFSGVDKDSVNIFHAGSSLSRAVIVLDGTDHVTFENMKIQAIGTYYCTAVHMRGGADSNTFSNCYIKVPTTGSYTNNAILASSSESTYYGYGNTANYNLFENNIITGGYFGACMNGSDKSNLCYGNKFIGNTFQTQYYYGARFYYQGNTVFKNNKILNTVMPYGYGLYFYYSTNSTIEGNILHPGRYAIYLNRENYQFSQNSTRIINNMISDFSDQSYQIGIYTYYSNKLKIYHNSILTDGNISSASYANIRLLTHCDSSIIKNNILANTTNSYLLSLSYSVGTEIDFNNYYYPNNTQYAFYNHAYYSNLNAFKNSSYYIKTPHDTNSFDNVYPGFLSSSDLHIHDTVGGIGGDTLNVVFDADGDLRCLIYPTIGADEKGIEAKFTINDTIQCFTSNNFIFTNNSITGSDSVTYLWNFGDNNQSTLINPAHSYSVADTYQIKLVATPINGCSDSITKSIVVLHSPTASFTINDSSQCLTANNFVFTNTSSIGTGNISYSWAFGDGYSASLTSPSHNYNSSDTFNVQLVVTSNLSCADTATKNAYVHPKPDADFSINDNSQCIVTNNFNFTNQTTINSGNISYLWKFGDGDTSTLTDPSHTYANYNSYYVTLIATSGLSCTDSIIKQADVNPMPVADFSINDSTQCLNANNFVYTNNSTISSGYLAYSWQFGDGNSSNSINPSHSFATADTYNVKLIAISAKNCKDSITKNSYVFPKPNPNFTINDSTQCLSSNNFIFTNTTNVNNGALTYLWNFGDGNNSTSTNAVHSYNFEDTFTVKLIATTSHSCMDSITKNVEVFPTPIADFSINDTLQCLLGNSFSFTNSSSISSGSLTYYWNFGDGNNSTSQNPTHSYISANTYNVKLVINSGNSCADSIIKKIYVVSSPNSGFTVNDTAQCFVGNNFIFTNTTTNIDTNNSYYLWSFGDGTTSSSKNPTHTYPIEGNYQVKLKALAGSCSDSVMQNIYVYPSPTVQFSLNDSIQCLSNNYFAFTNNTSINSGTLSFTWQFGDSNNSSLPNPTHSYSYSDTFDVKLISTSNKGCSDSFSASTYVLQGPIANFSINDSNQCLSGNSFVFTNNSVNNTSSTVTYHWNFGDGSSSTGKNASHSYLSSGSYNIELTINSAGCNDSIIKTVVVNPSPFTNYVVNDSNQCLGNNSFVFSNYSNISSGNISYKWYFGDGNSSTTKHPSHSYSTDDTFSVKLVSVSNRGCKDSMSITTYVFPNPLSNFSISDSVQCFSNNSFVFTNSSSINSGSLSYLWNFGDGNSSSSQSPSHSYLTTDTFTVSLKSSSNLGCSDSIEKAVYIVSSPIVNFSINDSSQCKVGNSFSFTNTSNVTGLSGNYTWYFGDATSSSLENPTHQYATAGTYNVKLIINPSSNCIDSITKNIYVYSSPTTYFSVNDSNQCLNNNNFIFTNNSTIDSGTLNYSWDFDDGNTSSAKDPSHIFASSNSFDVELITTSNNGCSDTFSMTNIVNPNPDAGFSISNNTQCLGVNNFILTNSTTIPNGTFTNFWNFGDGNNSSLSNPNYSYQYSDTFDIKLITISNNGCKDSITKSVYVNPKPTANFSINDSIQCFGGNYFVFTNNSSSLFGIQSKMWNLGDGYLSTMDNPTHSYASTDTFEVSIMITSTQGCKDTLSKNIVVLPSPTANFSITNNSQCLTNNSFTFTNTSFIPDTPAQYIWHFGDGDSSIVKNPTHSFATNDTFEVTLFTTSAQGCVDSISKNVFVQPKPVADFSIADSSQCLFGNNFSFTNNSTISSQTTMTYQWDFDDGNILNSNATTVSHSYANDNIYLVKLIATSNFNCTDSVSKNVYLRAMPEANFFVNDTLQCFTGNNFVFSNTTNINTGTYSSYWEFGDGSTSSLKNPSYSYQTVLGKATVKLYVSSNYGCEDSFFSDIKLNPSPYADFSINDTTQCLNGNKFVYTNLTSIPYGSLVTKWYFGDGTTSYKKNPERIYNAPHSFLVSLAVTSYEGCKDSIAKIVTVYPKPNPEFDINDKAQCLNNNDFKFTNRSTLLSGTMTYLWDLGDGSKTTVYSPSNTYSNYSTYKIKLFATSNQGCFDSISKNIIIRPNPKAKFTINDNSQCFGSDTFKFVTTSTIDVGYMTYFWRFGDGSHSTDSATSHSYSQTGNYNVTLIASSEHYCKDSIVKQAFVRPIPHANFFMNDTSQCLNENYFKLTDISWIDYGSMFYKYYFGDGNNSNFKNPDNIYQQAGNYNIKLKLNSNYGCKDSIIKIAYVLQSPIVNLGADTTIDLKESIVLDAGSGYSSYLWNDNSTSQTKSINGNNEGLGNHFFSVYVIANNGCTDSDTIIITVKDKSGINENENKITIKIYPNPARDFINFEILNNSGNQFIITLTSMNGKTVFNKIYAKNIKVMNEKINISEFAKGIYILKIQSNNSIETERIMIY